MADSFKFDESQLALLSQGNRIFFAQVKKTSATTVFLTDLKFIAGGGKPTPQTYELSDVVVEGFKEGSWIIGSVRIEYPNPNGDVGFWSFLAGRPLLQFTNAAFPLPPDIDKEELKDRLHRLVMARISRSLLLEAVAQHAAIQYLPKGDKQVMLRYYDKEELPTRERYSSRIQGELNLLLIEGSLGLKLEPYVELSSVKVNGANALLEGLFMPGKRAFKASLVETAGGPKVVSFETK